MKKSTLKNANQKTALDLLGDLYQGFICKECMCNDNSVLYVDKKTNQLKYYCYSCDRTWL